MLEALFRKVGLISAHKNTKSRLDVFSYFIHFLSLDLEVLLTLIYVRLNQSHHLIMLYEIILVDEVSISNTFEEFKIVRGLSIIDHPCCSSQETL